MGKGRKIRYTAPEGDHLYFRRGKVDMNVLRRQQRHGADTQACIENQRSSECDRAHSLPKLVDRGLDKIPVEFLAMHGSLRISKAEMLTQSQFPHALCSNSRKYGTVLEERHYLTGIP